jgi:hypothetical protein
MSMLSVFLAHFHSFQIIWYATNMVYCSPSTTANRSYYLAISNITACYSALPHWTVKGLRPNCNRSGSTGTKSKLNFICIKDTFTNKGASLNVVLPLLCSFKACWITWIRSFFFAFASTFYNGGNSSSCSTSQCFNNK